MKEECEKGKQERRDIERKEIKEGKSEGMKEE